jgi:hypothetical protein
MAEKASDRAVSCIQGSGGIVHDDVLVLISFPTNPTMLIVALVCTFHLWL